MSGDLRVTVGSAYPFHMVDQVASYDRPGLLTAWSQPFRSVESACPGAGQYQAAVQRHPAADRS